MHFSTTAVAASAAFVAFLGAAQAQDTPTQGQGMSSMPAMELPEACGAGQAPGMQGMGGTPPEMGAMGEHQRAFVQGMMGPQEPMMQGVMAEDPDVAFACGMIPHHQAAINMAEVELQYGDDEQMKEMAQAIIDAQKQEIEELTSWIEEHAQ